MLLWKAIFVVFISTPNIMLGNNIIFKGNDMSFLKKIFNKDSTNIEDNEKLID